MPPRLTRRDFATDPVTLAQRLIGARLVRILDDGTRLSGDIVETEAYLGVEDRAAHSFAGRRTARTEPMYARPGTSYVYFTYGMHHCMNVVCGRVNEPVAVLIRALAPVEGLDFMRARRMKRGGPPPRDRDLCSGPGKLCQAMALDRSHSGLDLVSHSALFIERTRPREQGGGKSLVNTPRIGVDHAGEWAAAPLRWRLAQSEHISRP